MKAACAPYTVPEVFILESLSLEDEDQDRFEGRILADVLKLCGRKPIYYYFRTLDELVYLAQVFRETNYRYLHFSCHGSEVNICTTFDYMSYVDFADIFSGLLKNRRLFMSACEVGDELFSTVVFGKNKGMYSIAGPKSKICFSEACGFWSSFYAKVFAFENGEIKNVLIRDSIEKLCGLYRIQFLWSWHNTCYNKIEVETLGEEKVV